MKVCATPPRMKRLMPLPIPQPFWIISSSRSTTMLARKSWKKMTIAWLDPRAPRAPPRMYAPASTAITTNVRILVDEPKIALSSGFPRSSLSRSLPWSSWRMSPAVTMGPIPSSMRVPWLEAKIILRNANWSVLLP